MRDGNRRKEKKMKIKLLATIAICMLLLGTLGMIISTTKAVDTYWYLTIGYGPTAMPEPDTAPTVGEHAYTVDSVINVTAPLIVDDTTGIRWSFLNWTVYYPNNTTAHTFNNKFPITMDENKTAVAYYKIQYYLDVISPFGTPWGKGWFDEYTTHWAGLDVGVVTIGTAHKAWFINWTGDGSGTNYISIDSAINMTGPKTVVANWVEKYYLWTDSSYYPWGGGYDPNKEGYKPYCTYVDLTAPTYDSINPLHWRWRFDRWEIEKWNYTSAAWELSYTETTENITVHIDAPITATVYFHLQYYLTVTDSPSAIDSGVESQSDYYDYCSNVTLIAEEYVPDPSDPGARWVFKQWYIAGVIDWYDTTLIVHIGAGWDKTAVAIYTKQYYITVKTDPPGVPAPTLTGAGWYDVGASVTVNASNMVYVDTATRYMFVEWDFTETGGGTTTTNPYTFSATKAWNATAAYQKQFKGTWTADPNTLNTKIGAWPGEGWFDENVKVWWSAPSGPIADYPFDYYFDHWDFNGVPQTQYMNSLQINFTEPMNTVANYLGKPAFFITPQTVIVDAPAECTYFEVNVTAANLVDLYGVDFKVTWNPAYIELVDVDVEVDEIWTQYFIGMNDWNNTEGWYHLVATSLDGAPADPYGFNGTHKIVKLTFHIIYDPCYIATDHYRETPLTLDIISLADSNGAQIYPWNVHGGYYRINAIQPKIEMRPAVATASQKGCVFTVEIWIVDAVKLHDYWFRIDFNTDHLDIIGVEIDTTFLTGPYEMFYYMKNDASGWIEIQVIQQQPGETLAYGEGRLVTLTFKVHDTIFWTTSNPILNSWISFSILRISVKCPDYHMIYASLLDYNNCEYKYLPIPGDVNMDGIVNVLDLQLVAADYGSTTLYDLDEDADVDLFDLVLVAINFGRDEP